MESAITTRPPFGWAAVAPVAARFGPFEHAGSLPSERDLNFLLRCAGGERQGQQAVLKVHNPSDSPELVQMQSLALERAASVGASCQRLIRTSDGEAAVPLALPAPLSGSCLCRMLTFLPGQVLAKAAEALESADERAALWARVGGAVGTVTSALLSFEHPAAHREFVWDLALCESTISLRAADVAPERRPLIDRALARYRRDLVPILPSLRRSVVHNDANDYNLVVDESGAVGVLDFGDMLYSYTCSDPAICMAYLLFHCPADCPLVESALPFVRGFHAECPLEEAEADALFGLAVMRVCTSVCMSAYQSKLEPDNEYLLVSAKPAWALLERLAAESSEDLAPALIRKACNLPPITVEVDGATEDCKRRRSE